MISLNAFTQPITTYYDYKWQPCDPLNARFYSVKQKTDSGWLRQDFFASNQRMQMHALYEDSACKILNGQGVWFFPNGKVSEIAQSVHNKKEGVCMSFYSNGVIADSATYHNGRPVGDKLSWYMNGFIADSTAHINDSMDVRISWYDNGKPSYAGYYLKGKFYGKWKFFHKNGNLASEEVYKQGKLVSKQYYDDAGKPQTDTTSLDKPATFKGGSINWEKYLAKNLYWPNGYRFDNGNMAVVVIQIIINEDGKIEHAEVVTPFHPEFDRIALKTIEQSPPWEPAISHNRFIKYKFRQSVIFKEQAY